MNYIILSLIFAVGRSFTAVYQKIISQNLKTDWKVFSFIYFLASLIPSLVFYLISPWKISLEVVKNVLPVSLCFVLGGSIFNYVISKKDISIVGGLQPLKLIFVSIFAFLFLGESFSWIVYLFISILIVSGFFVVYDEDFSFSDFFNFSVLLFLISQLLFSLSDIFSKKAFSVLSPISFMSANLFFTAFLSTPFWLPFILKDLKKISFKQVKAVTLNSWATFAFVVFLVMAFEDNVTISNTISNLIGPFILVFTIIIGFFKPGFLEKHTKKVYWIRTFGAFISYLAAIGIIFFV